MLTALVCYGCHRTLEPTSQVLHEDGQVDTYTGEEYRMIDGRAFCEGCQLQQRRECRPVATYSAAVPASSPYADLADVYYEETHRGLDSGSHGSRGKSGRCKRKKAYSAIVREPWQP